MTLREYKIKNRLRTEDLADMLGISPGHASDLINSRRNCSLEIAVKVEEITNGRVRCRDLLVEATR